jgi:heme A synthase
MGVYLIDFGHRIWGGALLLFLAFILFFVLISESSFLGCTCP